MTSDALSTPGWLFLCCGLQAVPYFCAVMCQAVPYFCAVVFQAVP